MFTKQTLFLTCLFASSLISSTPVPTEGQAPSEHQNEARDGKPQYYMNNHEPNYNVTCRASDTACVMGLAGPSSKRDAVEVPEVLEGQVEKRQFASNGIQAAAQNAGISGSQSTLNSKPSNSTGICKASDTACVMGVRSAEPEAEVEPINVRIAQLQSELEDIKAKRAQMVKRVAAPIPAATKSSSSSTITSTSTSTTSTATTFMTTTTMNSTTTSSTTSMEFPRSTNVYGRVVCKASDTACVLGITR